MTSPDLVILTFFPSASAPLLTLVGFPDLGSINIKFEMWIGASSLTIPPSGFFSGSILSIYTRNGKGLFGALNITEGQKMFDVQGFAVSKQFYTPKYDVDDSYFDNKPDLRQTIFWEPQAKSKNGESAEVRYFHSDNAGEFMVFIETISENGKIGYKQLEYTVKGSNND